jgi:hypothetical protein
VSANIASENAIRTGGWAVPIRAGPRRPYATNPKSNRKFYFVLDGQGDRLGYIANSEERPALMTGGPTYYLKRAPCHQESMS